MSNHTMDTRPSCTWVPVTGADGRTRLEARWSTAAGARAQAA